MDIKLGAPNFDHSSFSGLVNNQLKFANETEQLITDKLMDWFDVKQDPKKQHQNLQVQESLEKDTKQGPKNGSQLPLIDIQAVDPTLAQNLATQSVGPDIQME